jgi:signal peptidase II
MFMKKFAVLLVILIACVGCDQGTKYTAKHFLENQKTLSYMGDIFRLSYTENSGGFLSLGAGLPENVRLITFVVLTPIFLAGFLLFVICSKKLNVLAVSSSALIISGGLGNLIDRIINQGAVIDFMNIGIGSIRTGIFNVADLAIMAGVFMFLIFYVKNPHNKAV